MKRVNHVERRPAVRAGCCGLPTRPRAARPQHAHLGRHDGRGGRSEDAPPAPARRVKYGNGGRIVEKSASEFLVGTRFSTRSTHREFALRHFARRAERKVHFAHVLNSDWLLVISFGIPPSGNTRRYVDFRVRENTPKCFTSNFECGAYLTVSQLYFSR